MDHLRNCYIFNRFGHRFDTKEMCYCIGRTGNISQAIERIKSSQVRVSDWKIERIYYWWTQILNLITHLRSCIQCKWDKEIIKQMIDLWWWVFFSSTSFIRVAPFLARAAFPQLIPLKTTFVTECYRWRVYLRYLNFLNFLFLLFLISHVPYRLSLLEICKMSCSSMQSL